MSPLYEPYTYNRHKILFCRFIQLMEILLIGSYSLMVIRLHDNLLLYFQMQRETQCLKEYQNFKYAQDSDYTDEQVN